MLWARRFITSTRLLTAVSILYVIICSFSTIVYAAIFHGNPSNYRDLLSSLQPGDTLILEPGIYDDPSSTPGLPFFNVHGEPGKPITITGMDSGPRPIILGRSTHNTIRFDNASYIILRNLEIDGRNLGGDGVKAQGISHNITLENLYIHGVGSHRQIVGISTKATAWDWVIRNNIIVGAGTGVYLGNSDGNAPFIRGLIEYNLIMDTIGYNMEIKHQKSRPSITGLPMGQSKTIIRHNVFSKAVIPPSTSFKPRPNLLVGHFPLSGSGQDDVYEIYGNFFYQNPTGEALFQGEGNIALYNNLFVNTTSDGDAIWIQPHNDVPKEVRIFHNTVLAKGTGIKVIGGSSSHVQKVIGNAVFATTPIRASDQSNNITDSFSVAGNYLSNPFDEPGALDLYPKPGMLGGSLIDTSSFSNMFTEWDTDYNGNPHTSFFRGAYAGEGANPGWLPKLQRKPMSLDNIPPLPPTSLEVF